MLVLTVECVVPGVTDSKDGQPRMGATMRGPEIKYRVETIDDAGRKLREAVLLVWTHLIAALSIGQEKRTVTLESLPPVVPDGEKRSIPLSPPGAEEVFVGFVSYSIVAEPSGVSSSVPSSEPALSRTVCASSDDPQSALNTVD